MCCVSCADAGWSPLYSLLHGSVLAPTPGKYRMANRSHCRIQGHLESIHLFFSPEVLNVKVDSCFPIVVVNVTFGSFSTKCRCFNSQNY